MFKIKYGLNRMHSTIFAHQMGWFNDKGVDIHPWGLRYISHFCLFFALRKPGLLLWMPYSRCPTSW